MTEDQLAALWKSSFIPGEAAWSGVARFAELVRQDEREACAVLCEQSGFYESEQYADAIRARGE